MARTPAGQSLLMATAWLRTHLNGRRRCSRFGLLVACCLVMLHHASPPDPKMPHHPTGHPKIGARNTTTKSLLYALTCENHDATSDIALVLMSGLSLSRSNSVSLGTSPSLQCMNPRPDDGSLSSFVEFSLDVIHLPL